MDINMIHENSNIPHTDIQGLVNDGYFYTENPCSECGSFMWEKDVEIFDGECILTKHLCEYCGYYREDIDCE